MARRKKVSTAQKVLLTIPDVAIQLDVCRATVYNLMYFSGLPYVVIGGARRVHPTSLHEWIKRNERGPKSCRFGGFAPDWVAGLFSYESVGRCNMARQRKKSVCGGGSVFLRKDGRWEAKFKVEATGKYKSLYAGTENEVYKLLEDAKYQQREGTLATSRDQTVKQFLEYWLKDVEKPASRRLNTYIDIENIVRLHLIPDLGHMRLQTLTSVDLQSLYAKKLRIGTSASRIVSINRVLHKALKHARFLKIVGVNVAQGIKLPHVEKYKRPVLEAEQARLLLEKAKEYDLDVIIALAVVTGMRRGEILGLRWSDIDLVNGELRVARTLNYKGNYGFFENDPKSETSKRLIMLPRFMVDMLHAHYECQLKLKTEIGADWVERNLVFTGKNGKFIVPNTLLRHFYRLLEDMGLPPMHFHDLRHSAATILLSMGVPANVVQELLGHSDVPITLGIYGHVLPSMRRETVDKLEGLYRG